MTLFHNIFSERKIKQKEKPRVTIDYREKNSLIPSLLSKNFNVEFKQLPVADYIINNIAIERKTLPDFKSSIISKRMINQIKELKQYPKHLIILEGFNQDAYSGFLHENAFRGFLLSTLLEQQVPIIFTLNEKDTAQYLLVLAKKRQKKEFPIRASKIFLTKKEQLQFILEGFPNIGPVSAKKILKKFKTLHSISLASEKDLKEVIGKKSEAFYKLMHSKY